MESLASWGIGYSYSKKVSEGEREVSHNSSVARASFSPIWHSKVLVI
jgi:hypothetical protein